MKLDNATRDDEVFKYALIDLLKPYTEAARDWWANFENRSFTYTSTFPVQGAPDGFFEKCSRSPRHSCVYGLQAFPIVSVSHLTLPKMVGGAMQHVEEICKKGFEVEEFTLISKRGLQSTIMNGLFLCYIPTVRLSGAPKARWIYMRPNEIVELASGIVTASLVKRIQPYANEYKGDCL